MKRRGGSKDGDEAEACSESGAFKSGDEVEVCSEEEGFAGSYFEATVVRFLPKPRRYTVSYLALVNKKGSPLQETVDARLLRPRPPPASSSSPRSFGLHDYVDALYEDGWWFGVVVELGPEESQVSVCFPLHREVRSCAVSLVRPHLEWLPSSASWVPPSLLELPPSVYREGSHVQVVQPSLSNDNDNDNANGNDNDNNDDDDDDTTAWLPATVSKPLWNNNYLVSYSTSSPCSKPLKQEIVHLQHLRSCPSPSPSPSPTTPVQVSFDFHTGMIVEVSSEEDGFKGAWFAATLVSSLGTGTAFSVEYHHLKNDDQTAPLQETVDVFHIRPVPPETRCGPGCPRLLEEVDAHCNDAWWVGIVSKVLPNNRYIVYFRQWKEEMEFDHDQLRPHFDWIGTTWIRPSLALEL